MQDLETMKELPPELESLHSDSTSISSAVPSPTSSSKNDETQFSDSENGTDVQAERNKPVRFCVKGLYTMYPATKEEEESCERQFICRRRRMNTRPFKNTSDEKEDDVKKSDDDEEVEYETAMFIPKIGLVGAKFWHQYDKTAKVIREDRAVLFQSQEHYQRLMSHKRYGASFEDIDYMLNPTFGEQVIVSGIDISDLAIGDIFEIEGGHSPLVVEITAPRKPCTWMNRKHGTANGRKGIQNYSHKRNIAGWFARVLVAGELLEEMKFVRKAHPNPKWTLTCIHKALYGEGDDTETLRNQSSWNRSREELEELIAIPQLGEFEWKAEGRKRLLKFDGIDWMKVRRDLIDPQSKAPNFFVQYFCITSVLASLTAAALKYFGIL